MGREHSTHNSREFSATKLRTCVCYMDPGAYIPQLAFRVTVLVSLISLCHGSSGSVFVGDEVRQRRSVEWATSGVPHDPGPVTCANVTFPSGPISLGEQALEAVNFSINCSRVLAIDGKVSEHLQRHHQQQTVFHGLNLLITVLDQDIAVIEGQSAFNFTRHPPQEQVNETLTTLYYTLSTSTYRDTSTPATTDGTLLNFRGNFSIRGLRFGRTVVMVTVTLLADANSTMTSYVTETELVVKKEDNLINLIYLIVIGIMIVIYNFGFGCKVRAPLILEIVKRPVAPAIGFCCQFLIMSPLSYGVALLLKLPPETGLGLLAIGSAPGGGGSNVFAYLLDGDLELSITMTFVSTVASLGMTPLWIWALGRFFMEENTKVKIPVANVFSSLAIVTIPVIIGLLVSRYKPRIAEKIARGLKPATAVIGIVFISLGVYVYYSSLRRVTWQTIVACIIVSFCGYTLGASIGKLCRQPRKRWITIALETGFQNLALSLMIIATSLDQPESDLAGVVPVCYTFLSSAMPTLVFLGRCIHMLCHGEKPWAKSQSCDVSPPNAISNDLASANAPNKYDLQNDLALDTSGVEIATVAQLPPTAKFNQNENPGNDVVQQNGVITKSDTPGEPHDVERL